MYLELCRPVEEIDKAQHKHAELGLTGPDVWTPDPPRDIVTTLWGERIELESEEFRVCVSESSVLGSDLSRPKPPTRSAEAPRSYHIVETPGEIDWRNEVQIPTEEYYDALRADMEKTTPEGKSARLGPFDQLRSVA